MPPKTSQRLCSVEGCSAKHYVHSYCAKHFARWKKHGDVNYSKYLLPWGVRFWARVDKDSDPDGCWLWTGATNGNGYGVSLPPKISGETTRYTHRQAYLLEYGAIPEGMEVDHICHVTLCVRPSHLRAVTPRQNQQNYGGLPKNNTSGHRNVIWEARRSLWRVGVNNMEGKSVYGGYFSNLDEAALAAKNLRLKLHTHNDGDRV